MKSSLLPIVLTFAVVSGTGTAQQCPVGCQSKIDALRNEVAALEKGSYQVPYLQKFMLTPTQQDPAHSLFVERVLPNYLDVLLVHVTMDHKVTAVLLPSATPAPSDATTRAPNQAIFSSSCRISGNVSAPAKVAVSLGLLRQDASGNNVFGIRVTVDGCNPTTGQIPVEITVLSEL
jgi:hypothetical protein